MIDDFQYDLQKEILEDVLIEKEETYPNLIFRLLNLTNNLLVLSKADIINRLCADDINTIRLSRDIDVSIFELENY